MDNLLQIMKQNLQYTFHKNTRNIERYKRVLEEHKEIFASIKRKDSQEAVASMKRHLENVKQKLLALEE
jgi:GntR family transcriptional repressor for pyruvate dehydrogenase complex